jgi:2-polyprenyl-6-methoxyphenol hydroxylase-like FAD-dependent oxidoreductase
MPSVLISGASIAGPALAYWLKRHGFAVTVVERSTEFRLGGQPIDIRGAALEVVARMGLKERIESRRTRIAGVNVLDPRGNEIARHTDRTLSAGRHDSGDVEIFRDDLSALVYAATKDDVDYRFDDWVAAIDNDSGMVAVTLARGSRREFDLVIGADGIYSGVRSLVFGATEPFLKYLGAYVAIFTTENFLGLKGWQTAIGTEDHGIMVMPARDDTELRVFMMFASEPLGRTLTLAQQKILLVDKYQGFGWETPRLLAALQAAPDLYFGEIAQIKMPRWSLGRVALVGDAGYCPSPRSGQGTSLALVGAYLLAAELAACGNDYSGAFMRYEERMRPFVERNQAIALRSRTDPGNDAALDDAKNAIELPPG